MIIDTHAHYDHKRYDKDRHETLQAQVNGGITKIINIGCDLASSQASVKLAEAYSYIYATVGTHPHAAKEITEESMAEMIRLCQSEKVVAYGEIGLDYHYDFSPRDVQLKWFKRQLVAAAQLGLPVVIHSRDAAWEVFGTIKESPVRRGVIHSFSGDAQLALAYVELGFHIGIGGVVTFDNADELRAAVAATPMQRILLETDCPYLTPVPHRGKRNESRYLSHVAAAIGKIKSVENVADVTAANAVELFGLE
ncbi:MAG: TatD family hydrolase [Defluviitaleaceae bacterium]|nr:TatD family hydrolase [Defluviitaleaceae bacterium]